MTKRPKTASADIHDREQRQREQESELHNELMLAIYRFHGGKRAGIKLSGLDVWSVISVVGNLLADLIVLSGAKNDQRYVPHRSRAARAAAAQGLSSLARQVPLARGG